MSVDHLEQRIAIAEEQLMLKSPEDAAIDARFIQRDRDLLLAMRLIAEL